MPRLAAAPLLALLALAFLPAAPVALAQESMHHARPAAVPSTTLTVQAGAQTLTLSLTDLQALPQTTLEVFNAHSKQTETYAGPLLADVLAKAGFTLTESTQHQVLDSYVIATGTDSYFVIYSGAEIEPSLSKAKVIVALTRGGQPLGPTGAFQLISSEDAKPARWVRNLTRLACVFVAPAH